MDFVRVIIRGKLTIIGCMLLGLMLGYLYYLTQPAKYKASGRVLVLHETPNIGMQNGQSSGPTYSDEQALTSRLAAHVSLLTSTAIAEKAAQDKKLHELKSLAAAADPAVAIAGSMFARRVTTDRSNEVTNVLQVSYSCEHPGDAKLILSAVLNSYQIFLKKLDDESNSKNKLILVGIKSDLDKKLDESHAALESLQRALKNPGFTVADLLSSEDELKRLEADIGYYETCQEIARGQLFSIEKLQAQRLSNMEILQVLTEAHQRQGVNTDHDGNKEVPLQMSLVQLYVERASLEVKNGRDSSKWKEVNARILTLQKWLGAAEPSQRADLLDMHRRFLKGQIDHYEIAKKFHDERRKALTQKAGDARSHRLTEMALTAKQVELGRLRENIAAQLANLDLTKSLGGYKAIVIEEPQFGIQTDPNFGRIMLLGLVLGLGGGLLASYLVELSDKSFRSPEEIRAQLGVNVLGHIPVLPPASPQDKLVANTEGLAIPDRTLFAYHRPRSRMAEAFRAVRTALYFGAHGATHRIIQVTSPNPGDGKSTLSSNLAASIAQSGKRVLLIDADFRRPRAHKLYGISSRIGVTAAIQGSATIEEATHRTAVENLFIMPCGARPDNPSELLTSPKFQELLETVRGLYDFVIVDTPPLLAVTDPCAVAARVDGVIIAIRIGQRKRSAIIRATEMLESIGANVMGVVVNGVGPADNQGENGYNSMAYGYGSKYYQYGQEYYIAGDGDNPNYGYDDSPSQRLKKISTPASGTVVEPVTNGAAKNGSSAGGVHRPAELKPSTDALAGNYTDPDAVPPHSSEYSSNLDEGTPKPPSTLKDLLRKHQRPDEAPPNKG